MKNITCCRFFAFWTETQSMLAIAAVQSGQLANETHKNLLPRLCSGFFMNAFERPSLMNKLLQHNVDLTCAFCCKNRRPNLVFEMQSPTGNILLKSWMKMRQVGVPRYKTNAMIWTDFTSNEMTSAVDLRTCLCAACTRNSCYICRALTVLSTFKLESHQLTLSAADSVQEGLG